MRFARTGRTSPSCATLTASVPSAQNTCPVANPRPAAADGLWVWYSNQSSARKGRWNHITWSRLAIM